MTGLLRLEALVVAAALCAGLWTLAPAWWLVVLVLVLPDLAMIGYAAGPVRGANIYNAAHSYVLPVLLGMAAVLWGLDLWLQVALIWALHIAIDRVLGYGLKLREGFHATHLGRIGREDRNGTAR